MRTLKTFVLAALAAAVVVSPAWAQVNLNDSTRKIRGDYGQNAGVTRSYRSVRAAPVPSVNRTFSYEPARATQPCQAPAKAAPQKAAAVTPAPKRAFSYEPAQRSSVRTYQAPRKETPTYLLPKGDPRRYDGIRW